MLGNMVFIAGKGAHFAGDITSHTDHVLKELEKELILAGSSMDKVLKVNVDECSELSVKFGIRSIPTIVVLKDGKEITRQTGSGPVEQKIKEMVELAKNSSTNEQ
jgi:thioredoxin-like negative regulator of GroEL